MTYADEDDWWADAAPEDCDHAEAELSWEGRFECSCGHSWWATAKEQNAYWQAVDRANRPPTLWERICDTWATVKANVRTAFRSRKQAALDDDIPF